MSASGPIGPQVYSCASCSYALKYFCIVELMTLYAILAENDATSFNVTPI